MGKFDLTKITEEDLATLAANGDSASHAYLWELIIPRVRRVIGKHVKPHRFLRRSAADISQGVLLKFPTFIKRWKADRLAPGSTFDKWLYFTISHVAQDVIREQKDSLGISIPQKKPYPQWWHVSEYAIAHNGERRGSECGIEGMLLDGIERIDRGYKPQLGWSENNE